MISGQNCTTRPYYSHFEITEFSQYQYIFYQEASLLKSGNKKTFENEEMIVAVNVIYAIA